MGIFSSIARWFRNWRLRRAQAISNAADQQFTRSADGIAAAYDLEQDSLIGEYKEFLGALGEVEAAIEQKRKRLTDTRARQTESQQALDGALAELDRREAAGENVSDVEADANDFLQEVNTLGSQAESLENEIKEQEGRLGALERQLKKMQEEIAKLPTEKAEAIADIVSNQRLAEANERLMGIGKRSNERSPLDAVRKHREEVAGKARVTSRVANTATEDRRDKYRQTAKTEAAHSDVRAMLAARRAEKAKETGDTARETTGERPQI